MHGRTVATAQGLQERRVWRTISGKLVVLVILLQGAPGALPILILTLGVALYLTVIELRPLQLHWKWWGWWLSLVFLTHFIGYLALRIYVAYRRRSSARA